MQPWLTIGAFFTIYNIICGMIYRFQNNDIKATACGLEASVWFVATCIAGNHNA